MTAMAPLFRVIFNLEGFEATAFWLALFIGFLGAGFFVDYLMGKQGFGVFFNGIFVYLGGFVGLYLRYNYFFAGGWPKYDPYLTFGLFFMSITILLVCMSFVRNRT